MTEYCCDKYKWFDEHFLYELGVIRHMDDEELFCCDIQLVHCPFCGQKL